MKKLVLSILLKYILTLVLIFNVGCVSFPFYSKENVSKSTNVKIILTIDPVVKHEDGSDYFPVDESLLEYASRSLNSCNENCAIEVKVKAHFVASSNSESTYFKVWQWVGVLTLSIIPVYEKTKFTLIAEVQSKANANFILEKNRHLVLSILLFPFNIFRSWREDLLAPQKALIDQLAAELA